MKSRKILITGGAGYVGAVLVPRLLADNYCVTVYDLMIYGENVLEKHPNLTIVKGDIRDPRLLETALSGCDAVIHLACISDESSYDLDPGRSKSINFDAFGPFVQAAKKAGVKRFIYASSSCVYGITNDAQATEDQPLGPLSGFSKHKALCETVLHQERAPGFVTCIVRPANICGYAPLQRLDIAVNALTHTAFKEGRIKVSGGTRIYPSIHIDDMVNLYLFLLGQPDARIDGKVYNAVSENSTLIELAETVRRVVREDLSIESEAEENTPSYPVSSDRMLHELGFKPSLTTEDAIRGLAATFQTGDVPNSFAYPRYSNVKMMQRVDLD